MLAKMPNLFTDEQSRLLEAEAERRARNAGRLNAELTGDLAGRWYIATVQPNHEGISAGHLIARQFAVYHPQFPVSQIVRGRKREGMRTMFPGYLFVFVWGIDQHCRRILACTGVTGMVRDAFGAPIAVKDSVVDVVRAEENKKRPMTYIDEVIKVRRRRKKYTQEVIRQETGVGMDDIVSVRASGWIRGIDELAPEQRISKLHLALGLVS